MSAKSGFDLCSNCGQEICGRERILNWTLGYLEKYLCLECLAKQQGQPPTELCERLRDYLERRPCFHGPWREVVHCSPEGKGKLCCPTNWS